MAVTLRHIYSFDSYVLDVDERVLKRDGRIVPLTPKVFETLLLLVKNHGSVVTKQTILETLWPDVFVEESNITFNITMLRKALGDTKRSSLYIETVPRRGYRFKGEVREIVLDEAAPEALSPFSSSTSNGHAEAQRLTSALVQSTVQVPPESSVQQEVAIRNGVSVPSSSSLFVGRKPTGVLISGAAFVILLAVVAGARWQWNRRFSDREVPRTSPAALKLEQITTYGNVVCAAISPDGKQVVYVQENTGQQSLWLIQLGTFVNMQLIRAKEGTVYNKVSFSHDGAYIYFISHAENQPGDFYRVPILNGPPTKLVGNVEGNYSISSDDRTVVFRRRDRIASEDTLYIADLITGEERPLVKHKQPDWIRMFLM